MCPSISYRDTDICVGYNPAKNLGNYLSNADFPVEGRNRFRFFFGAIRAIPSVGRHGTWNHGWHAALLTFQIQIAAAARECVLFHVY